MSEQVRLWWARWGPWVGPSGIVAALAILTRLDACAYSPASIRALAETNKTRIEALEAVQKAQQDTWTEHLKVAEARIQLQDADHTDLAVAKEKVRALEDTVDRIEDKVDLLVSAEMRKGNISR